jgi:hypothetical protein
MTHMNIWRINHSRNIYVHTRGYQISDPKYSRRWKKLKLNESKEVITYRCRRFKWPGTKKKNEWHWQPCANLIIPARRCLLSADKNDNLFSSRPITRRLRTMGSPAVKIINLILCTLVYQQTRPFKNEYI